MCYFITALLIGSVLLLASCDVNSNGDSSTRLQVHAEPSEAGTVEDIGNRLAADASPGFVFRYWQVNHPDGTITTFTDDTITVQDQSVESATGVFGPNNISGVGPFTIKAGSQQRYAYYVTDFIMPIDTASRKSVNAVVRADLEKRTKQKIFITEKTIRRFDVSSDNQFIAFSSYDTGESSAREVDTFIYDLKNDELTSTLTGGVEPLWANTSNTLLIGSQNGVCIYDINADRCRNLEVRETSSINPRGIDAAAWSPDDSRIVLSRDTEDFYLFDTQTFDREIIESKNGKRYFIWLDNETFITEGRLVEKNNIIGLQYSLQNLSAPENLAYETNFIPATASPSKQRLAFINEGVNIYERTTDESRNILNFFEYDPITLTWVQENEMLFYGRNQKIVLRLTTNGEVIEL